MLRQRCVDNGDDGMRDEGEKECWWWNERVW